MLEMFRKIFSVCSWHLSFANFLDYFRLERFTCDINWKIFLRSPGILDILVELGPWSGICVPQRGDVTVQRPPFRWTLLKCRGKIGKWTLLKCRGKIREKNFFLPNTAKFYIKRFVSRAASKAQQLQNVRMLNKKVNREILKCQYFKKLIILLLDFFLTGIGL